MARTALKVGWFGVVVGVLAASTACWAVGTKTCLTGTDPAVAADAARITAVRALIDTACVCSSFDGGLGKTYGEYVRCAVNLIHSQAAVPPGRLRRQCVGTMKKYYMRSVCGRNPQLHFAPCVETSALSGNIKCEIKPTTDFDRSTPSHMCTSQPGLSTQVSCPAYTHCIDAADTDHNLVIAAPGDSGACAATPTPTATPTPRPNFLLINLDDSRFDGIDRMPVLQSQLIGAGVNFRNSFVPLSLCCPSRASILCGLYAFHNGTRQVAGPIGGAHTFRESGVDHQTISVWLHNAGYATGLFGKYLNAYSDEQDKGPGGGFYIPPGWTRWRAFVMEHYGGQNGVDYELVDEAGGRTLYNDHSTDDQYSTDVLAHELRQFIADSVAAGQPFFAEWTPFASHADVPNLQPLPAARHLHVLDSLPPARPPNWAEADVSDKPRWIQSLNTTPLLYGVTDVVRREAYETLLSVDEELDAMLQQLAALGIDDHTVVLLTSDNGVAWGEHRWYGQGKECPYEECIRVPMVVRYPRGVVGGPRTADTPVLNIDVPATIADLAGVSIPVPIDGKSFRPALEGSSTPLRDDFLLEHWSGFRNGDLVYSAQPLDGDRVRLFFGPWPKTSLLFEFDADGTVGPDSIAVPIAATADATFGALGLVVTQHVPNTSSSQNLATKNLFIVDGSPASLGVYLVDEANAAASFKVIYPIPDFFGVRDVANNFTYVEHASGEIELYDLTADPWELENKAGDPAYTSTQARLAARARELAELP